MKRLLVLLVLISCTVQAEIYKHQNEMGEWVYSDIPSPSAERLKLPPLSTYTPPPTVPRPVSAAQVEPKSAYKSMVFVKPVNEATIRDQAGTVDVKIALDPVLKSNENHKIQYFLDGKAFKKPVINTTFRLDGLYRGAHTLAAQVVDSKRKILIRAENIIIHVRRDSSQNPNNLNNPDNPNSLRNPDNIANNPNNPYHVDNNPNAPGPINPNPPKPPQP